MGFDGGGGGGGGNTTSTDIIYKFSKDARITIPSNDKFLIVPASDNPRRIEIVTDNLIEIYWEGQNHSIWTVRPGKVWQDKTTGDNLYVLCPNGTANINILVRSNKPINYEIGGLLMIPVKVRLHFGTGGNYIPLNQADYDSDISQYAANIDKLKNSDSGVTGFKIFDIHCFYPGKAITFNVEIDPNYTSQYGGEIALQLFDPLHIGEALMDVASDVINFELNDIPNTFIGRVTKNSTYATVTNNEVSINPDFSRHAGRFVAVNSNTNNFDTAIIKGYTSNSDPYKGGTFILTGDF